MATTTCRDCGNQISTAAKARPHCGKPVQRIGLLGGCAVVALLVLIGICFFPAHAPQSSPAAQASTATTPQIAAPPTTISDAGMTVDEKSAFLKTKAGRLWKKHDGEWSPDDCRAIVKGRIHPGMTADEVIASWGRPDHVNSSVYARGRHEQWVYNNANYVYFEDGVMTSLQQTK